MIKEILFVGAALSFSVCIFNCEAGRKGGGKSSVRGKSVSSGHSTKEKGAHRQGEAKQECKRGHSHGEKSNTLLGGKKFDHVDKNDDGKIGLREFIKEKNHDHNHNHRAVVNKVWEKKADANNNGKVEKNELKSFHRDRVDANNDGKITKGERKRFEFKKFAKVTNEREKNFDANNDGLISREERKAMIKAKLRLINMDGKARVDSDVERHFDRDKNNTIDKDEAISLKDALKDL